MQTAVPERVVLRGVSPREMRKRACCRFDERFGDGCWRLCAERTQPCLVSIGGRVRLYECEFQAVCAESPLA
jgi:hypothetical protein